jgi:hypothetical protein
MAERAAWAGRLRFSKRRRPATKGVKSFISGLRD